MTESVNSPGAGGTLLPGGDSSPSPERDRLLSPGGGKPVLPGGDRLLSPGGGKPRHYISAFLYPEKSALLRFILMGTALELLYLLVFALTPLSTTSPKLSPLGMKWSWTLALSQLLFHRSRSLSEGFSDLGPYFLLLGLTLIVLTGVYLCAVGRAFHDSNKIRITSRWLLLPLVGATIFGITLLFLPALFSNEVYGYIFSGRMLTIYHVDPIITPPAQIHQDPFFAWISQPNTPNVYGPLWLVIASLLVRVSNSVIVTLLLFKSLALLFHLINCILIWAILGKLAFTRRLFGTLLYAWNPLALIELAGNGHNDGMLICFLLLATWLYAQQKGGGYDVGAIALLGLAMSVNLVGILFTPMLIWFSVRRERRIEQAIWSFFWRAVLALAMLFIVYLPFWHGSSTYLALISSIDLQHFVHSPLGVLVKAMRWLFRHLFAGINIAPSYAPFIQPLNSANATVLSSTIFIFAFIYFYLLGKVRKAPVTVPTMHSSATPGFDKLFTSLSIVILGYIVLVSGVFWPWYVLWALWVIALRPFDALTGSVLLLSCTALLTYPLLYLDRLPIASYQPFLIFGIPLVYLIANKVIRRNERKMLAYDRRSETAQD